MTSTDESTLEAQPNRAMRRHPDEIDRLLDINELAARWGVSTSTIYNMRMRDDGPPSFKLGGRRVRYRLSEVVRWEDAQMGLAS